MATYSGFFNAVDHDRLYNATDFGKFFDGLIADGVYVNFPEGATKENRGLHVSPNTDVSGLSIKVAPGRCWFNGYWMYNDAFLPITLDTLLTTLVSRIDAIVVDVNGADSARTVDIVVVKGTEAQTPDKPSLIHTSTHNQYALAYVRVVPGATAISTQNIEDTILSGETPAVEALLEYSSRSKAEMKTYIDNADSNIQGQVNGIKTPTFTEAAELANLAGSGEGINTMWGKVKKLLTTILNILPVNYGGTGRSETTSNALLLGNGNNVLKVKRTGNGAFYATANDAEPQFGALPIAQGGTGATSAAGALTNLGVPSDVAAAMSKDVYCSNDSNRSIIDVEHGGTGKSSITSGKVLVGNGTSVPTERSIDTTSGGVQNSSSLTTAGALYATKTALQSTFQDGVDTIYNAIVAKGVTPSSSTPTDCATGINNMVKNVYNACVNNKLTPSAYTVPACVTAINGIRTVLRGAAIATGGYTYSNGISYNDLYPDTSNKVACGYAILQYTNSKGQPTLSGQSNEFDVTILFSGGTYSTISTKYGVCFIRRKYNVAAGISGTIRIVPNITNDANASLSIVLYEIY